MDYSPCDNGRASIRIAKGTIPDIRSGAGAEEVVEIDRYAHLMVGCRLGTEPERSAVDLDHRTWSLMNRLIADGSVTPTTNRGPRETAVGDLRISAG